MGNYTGIFDTLYWSPEEYSQLAQDLTKLGKNFEENVKAASEAINTLGTNGSWTGYLYNNLITDFNASIADINEDAEALATEIPSAIERQAEDQASANNGTISPVTLASLDGINNLTETEDDGTGTVYIDNTVVEDAINNVFVEDMNNAINIAKQYEQLFSSTISNGLNVSSDIKAMEYKIQDIVDSVTNFASEFTTKITDAANQSIAVMNAQQQASEAEVNNVSET